MGKQITGGALVQRFIAWSTRSWAAGRPPGNWTMMAALLVAVLFVSATASAQDSAIAGVVADASGAVMPGVTVEVTSPALIEGTRSVVSDGQGRYSVQNLRPGTYAVTF